MYPIETDGGLRVAGDHVETDDHAVVAPFEQLFTVLHIGLPSLTVQCCRRGTQLGGGDHVPVYAYRTVETPRWYLPLVEHRTEYANKIHGLFSDHGINEVFSSWNANY